MRQRCSVAAQVERACEVFRSERRAAMGQRVEQHADRRDAHHSTTAFAVILGRLADLDAAAQRIDAGTARCPAGKQCLLSDQPARKKEFLVTRVVLALGVQPAQVRVANHARRAANAAQGTRLATVDQAIAIGTARLNSAQRALDAYLATNPPAAQFHAWLKWNPAQNGRPVTPDTLRDRMNLSSEQRRLFQEYLYDRNPAYRKQVDKYRNLWATAKGDAERNIVARRARIHLSGEFGEQMARHALAPLGGRIETQGRTFVGDNGRYTKTDLLITDLRVPVILGRGEGMGAPVGGSMAFEVKCGKAEYLYSQKDHMVFQAEGHKQADAQCTLCSRDIHDLPPEKEKELRDTLRDAGSPMVGMLPSKNEIDQSCLDFIHQDEEVRS